MKAIKIKRDFFWSSFFFALGLAPNPYFAKAREIIKKNAEQRVADSFDAVGQTFGEVFEREKLND